MFVEEWLIYIYIYILIKEGEFRVEMVYVTMFVC